MKQRLISLDAVEITVIDEADHMADLGFLPGVTRILAATPAGGQRLLFSATLDNGVDKLVNAIPAQPGAAFRRRGERARRGDDPPRLPRVGCRREERAGAPARIGRPDAESCSCAPSIRPASSPSSSPTQVFRQLTCTATFLSPRATATSPSFSSGEVKGAGGHRHRRARHSRRRSRVGRAHRSARRAQGIPSPIRAHRASRQRGRRRHRRPARAAQGDTEA